MRFSASAFPAASVSTFLCADARSDTPFSRSFSAASDASRRLATCSPRAFFSVSALRSIRSASSTASAAADSVLSAADSSAPARVANAARSVRKDASRDSTVARSASMVSLASSATRKEEPPSPSETRARASFFASFFASFS